MGEWGTQTSISL